MHMLSGPNRSEFLATPQLIRFDHVHGADGREATLLIKGSTLLLKYIVLGCRMQLAFGRVDDRLICALKVYDDNEAGGVLWSAVESEKETDALLALTRKEPAQTFLFNEIAVNVAWAELPVSLGEDLAKMVAGVTLGQTDYATFRYHASPMLNRIHGGGPLGDDLIVAELPNAEWKPILSNYITNHASSSLIHLFNGDEGNQQEQIGVWLTDNLQPSGAVHSPQIPKGGGHRELTDIILSYPNGSFLFESKALTILTRERLPDRAKLMHDIAGHIEKATNQLRGAMRRLKDGTPVTSKAGQTLDIERTRPMHGIILLPDLELIHDRRAYGRAFIETFSKSTGGFLHLLDLAELLRVVQASEMIADRSTTTTPMMAFDYYLIERAKMALDQDTLCLEVLIRFAD